MNYLIKICILILLLACTHTNTGFPGIYNYVAKNEMNDLVSMTIKAYDDNTFMMFGMRKHKFSNVDTFSYLIYLTCGDWTQQGDHIMLTTNLLYKGMSKYIFQDSDSKYLDIKPWDLTELVIKVEQDSFIIQNNYKNLFSINREIVLSKE